MVDPLDIGPDIEHESYSKQNKSYRRPMRRDNKKVNSSGIRKIYQCPNCPSAYNRHDNLTQHLRFACLRKPRFACPYCNRVGKRTFNIYVHIRKQHPNRIICYRDLEKSNVLVTPNLKWNSCSW